MSLRREVCAAAAGAGSEREFFARLEQAGVLVRKRHSTINPGEVTGYAVGLADHTTKDGGIVWYGGGKLAPDLTLPQLRARWAGPAGRPRAAGHGVMARAVLRGRVTAAAEQARTRPGSSRSCARAACWCDCGTARSTRARSPGTRCASRLHGRDGSPRWYGGGRLAAGLTLPRLRRNWDRDRTGTDPRAGSFRLTGPEREQFYFHTARQADAAAEQIRRSARIDPAAATDTAWAAAAIFHATARAIGDPALRDVADAYDRAARMAYGKIPQRTAEGDGLRAAARLLAMAGGPGDGGTRGAIQLTASLVRLARAVGELRQAEQHAAQAAAARQAAERLYARLSRARGGATAPGWPQEPHQSRHARRPRDIASPDFSVPPRPGQPPPGADRASRDRGHRRPPDPCTARLAAPDRAADRTPAPSSGGPKPRAAQCHPGSIHAA